jgi:hypothetical protein
LIQLLYVSANGLAMIRVLKGSSRGAEPLLDNHISLPLEGEGRVRVNN